MSEHKIASNLPPRLSSAPGVSASAAEVDAVREHVAERLARFKRPRDLEVVATLPHSATGKVAKARLREDG